MADFNGDGHADIVAGRSGTDQTEVYPGDGHGGFAAPSTLPGVGPQVDPAVYLIGDLNHDTKLDLIITRAAGWQVLLNTCR